MRWVEGIMTKQSELQCWEIIQCNRKNKCRSYEGEEKECWQVIKDDNASSFHICVDCLVYLAKQKDSIFSDEELARILSKRQEKSFRHYECKLTYALRHSTAIIDGLCINV